MLDEILCDIYTHTYTVKYCEKSVSHRNFLSFFKKALDMKKLSDCMAAKIIPKTQLSLCWPFKK